MKGNSSSVKSMCSLLKDWDWRCCEVGRVGEVYIL